MPIAGRYWSPNPVKQPFIMLRHKLRVLNSDKRKLPDFLIIGVQKGGTTSLYHYLIQHPKVLPAIKKEVHYYDELFAHGIDWYKGFFPLKSESQGMLSGEASPDYIYYPGAPERLYKDNPASKLILLLRNPVERAYSHYKMMLKREIEIDKDVEEAMMNDDVRTTIELVKAIADHNYNSYELRKFGYLARGRYDEQVERWLKYFNRDQLMILESEQLYSDTQEVSNKCFKFLGLEDVAIPNDANMNPGTESKMPPALYAKLQEYYKPSVRRLEEMLNYKFNWDI